MDFLKGVKRGFVANFVDSSILEQAPYDVLGEGSDYEERFYPGGNWVMTVVKEQVEEVEEDNGTMTCFFRIQKYINGDNKDKVSLEMTFPVLVRVTYNPDSGAIKKGEIGIYVHPSRQSDPPLPNNETLYIERLEPMRVYARRFSGYAGDRTYMAEKDILKECLSRDNLGDEIDRTVSFAAGYDPPTKMFKRRNEVMFRVLKEDAAEEVNPAVLTTTES